MDTKKEIDLFHHFNAEKEKYYNQITRFIDPFGHFRKVMQPRVFPVKAMTNAWLKCWEIINEFNLLPLQGHSNVFCNAEFPGAFIYAIHHYIQTKTKSTYDWYANSLYPSDDGNSILGDEFGLYARYKEKWLMTNEKDNNGDVTNPTIIQRIQDKCGHSIDLYTSDIGIGLDYSTFEKQEQIEALLQLGQLLCGLSTLRKGGHLVCKQFMFFSPFSMSMMYLASECFDEFTIFKPQTSRPANSEMYIIGKGFKGYHEIESIYTQLMQLLVTWNDMKEEERMSNYIVPIPEHVYLTMYLALHRIYKRQIQYIKNNITTVSELYPSPATIQTVKNHYFFKQEQHRLREWVKRFDIPFRVKGQIDL